MSAHENTPRRPKMASAAEKPERGLNKIPQWLTREKGMPDWLAGSVVVVAGGLLLTLLVWLLILIFPAR